MDEKHFTDLARRAARTGRTAYTRFLEAPMLDAVRRCAREEGASVSFFGGYSDAERVVAAFHGDGEPEEYPIVCLDIRWNAKFASVGHRDLLGAVMALSIEREMTGDIILAEEGCALLFVLTEMAEYVQGQLTSAGRATLKIAPHEGPIVCPEPEGRRTRVTLASPRLDAFLAAGYDLSRSEAQKLIASGLVKHNHVPILRTDLEVREGDLISVRGFGRMKVEALLGQTRKGRLAAQVFRYGAK